MTQADQDRSAEAAPGTTELGIDIVAVPRIRETLARFGDRFTGRVLTDTEARYVRGRAETMAGRWAAKEAVSKVLGLGVRGVGWREIEIVRLPTGQPSVRLHGRARRRAEQLGMGRIAVSITHEREYAMAVAMGVRTAGGTFLFPPDIDARLDDHERRILARIDRLRTLDAETSAGAAGAGADPAAGETGSPAGRSATNDAAADAGPGEGG